MCFAIQKCVEVFWFHVTTFSQFNLKYCNIHQIHLHYILQLRKLRDQGEFGRNLPNYKTLRYLKFISRFITKQEDRIKEHMMKTLRIVLRNMVNWQNTEVKVRYEFLFTEVLLSIFPFTLCVVSNSAKLKWQGSSYS